MQPSAAEANLFQPAAEAQLAIAAELAEGCEEQLDRDLPGGRLDGVRSGMESHHLDCNETAIIQLRDNSTVISLSRLFSWLP